MVKNNKKMLLLEALVYGVLASGFAGLYFTDKIPSFWVSVMYFFVMAITFGYLFISDMLFPKNDIAVHYKMYKKHYEPTSHVPKEVHKRKGLWKVILLWACYLGVVGGLKLFGLLNWQLLLAGVCLMFLCNSFFIRKFCVLSAIAMHNKNNCCKNCGINGWDGLIFSSALIFAPKISIGVTVLNWVIILFTLGKFIEWEYLYKKYPERFFPETNGALCCSKCAKGCNACKKNK